MIISKGDFLISLARCRKGVYDLEIKEGRREVVCIGEDLVRKWEPCIALQSWLLL
jgi:hypothetical protein